MPFKSDEPAPTTRTYARTELAARTSEVGEAGLHYPLGGRERARRAYRRGEEDFAEQRFIFGDI